jgi:hypothetical protein
MLLQIIGTLIQSGSVIPPPPSPPIFAEHDWGAFQPIEKSERVSVLCRAGGRTIAEFSSVRRLVSVVNIQGLSHSLSLREREVINATVGQLGFLDRVQVGCNGRDAVITVTGAFEYVDGKSRQRAVSIVWQPRGISGVGGHELPEMELLPASR